MKSLIIGAGEVGQALKEVVSKTHHVLIRDIEPIDIGVGNIEVLHICYPDSDKFVEITQMYIEMYHPLVTIVNSSVSVGTCNQLSNKIVYSPIRGRHKRNGKPSLANDIRIFVKFIFCKDPFNRDMAAHYFEECGLTCYSFKDTLSGELVKLLSNIHMGIEIAWRQEVQRILEHFENVPQKVQSGASPRLYEATGNSMAVPKMSHERASLYEIWEATYAQGYERTGDSHLIRPRMNPDPIGGHCILPCTEILSKQFPSKIFDFIIESNEKAKREAFIGA